MLSLIADGSAYCSFRCLRTLPDAARSLWNPELKIGQGVQQGWCQNLSDRGMPEFGRNMVLETGEPLHAVLAASGRLDYPFVVVARSSRQSGRRLLVLGLSDRKSSLGCLSLALALVDRINPDGNKPPGILGI